MNSNIVELEYYPTPSWATEALLERVQFSNPIWEPAAGDGAMANVLVADGYEVVASDLYNYGNPSIQSGVDFLTLPPCRVGSVVTNPPFSKSEQFIRRALVCAEDKVAMLQRLAFLEGQGRRELWSSTPLQTVLVFSKRLSFGGTGKTAFAWFVWKQGFKGQPKITWI